MSSSKAIQGQSSPEVQAFINNIFDQYPIPQQKHHVETTDSAADVSNRYRHADTTLARKLAKSNLDNRLQLDGYWDESKTGKPIGTHARVSGFNSVVTFDEADGQVHVPVPFHHADDWNPSRIRRQLENSAPWQVQLDAPFKCALCRKIVTLRGQEAWMIHVYADLKAYICIHPECSQSFEYFHLWAEHVLSEHFSKLKRYCVYCNAEIVSTSNISTRNAFVQHLVYNHWDNLSDAERTAATLNSESFVLATFNHFPCGICRRSKWKTWYDFAAHVARHLEEISLAALYNNPYLLKDIHTTRSGKSKSRHWKKSLQHNPREREEPTKPRRDEERIKQLEEEAEEEEEEDGTESDESAQEDPDYVDVELELPNTPLPSIKTPHRGSLRPRKVPDNGTSKPREKKGEKTESLEVPSHGKLVVTGDNEVRVKFKDKDRRRHHRQRDDSQSNTRQQQQQLQQYPNENVEQSSSIESPYAHYLPYHFQYDPQTLGSLGYDNYRYAGAVSTPNYYNYNMTSYPHFRGVYDPRFAYQHPINEEPSFSSQCMCPSCAKAENYA